MSAPDTSVRPANVNPVLEPDPERDELEASLFQVVRFLMRGPIESPLSDLPAAQIRCLMIVGGHEGMKMQELAERLETTLPATSQIADRLVKRGLLERRDDPMDRRVVRLHLRDEARAVVQAKRELRARRVAAALEILRREGGLAEVKQALRLISSVADRVFANQQVESDTHRQPFTTETDPDTGKSDITYEEIEKLSFHREEPRA